MSLKSMFSDDHPASQRAIVVRFRTSASNSSHPQHAALHIVLFWYSCSGHDAIFNWVCRRWQKHIIHVWATSALSSQYA